MKKFLSFFFLFLAVAGLLAASIAIACCFLQAIFEGLAGVAVACVVCVLGLSVLNAAAIVDTLETL